MYAEEKLKIAMIDLMETEPFEKITVTELCKKSNVSRPTFYHHFTSLGNLAFEAIIYQVTKLNPDLQTWEDWLNNIKSVLSFMKDHKYLVHNCGAASIQEEAAVFLTRLIKKAIKRQETLLNYHLSTINEGFITRLYAETYIALMIEFSASDMTIDPDVVDTQCKALLGDAVVNALRGFMRVDQQS